MSYTDFDFPHSHMYESDLREVLAIVRKLEEIVKNFVNTEQIVFADPITWDITKQYTKGTIVLNSEGNAYLSKQAVPTGVELDNEEYWLEIFNFMDYVKSFNSNLTVNVESNTNRATSNYIEDDWLVLNDILYKVTSNIAIDDLFIIYPNEGYNIKHFTIEDFIKAFMTWSTNTINQYKDDIDASELAYVAAMQAEVDRILAGATVDSEVIDARLGADGINYSTLGNAIRSQIGRLDKNFNKFCLYNKQTVANNRWPRFEVPVVDGHTYIIRVLQIDSTTDYEICMLTQGATTFSNTLHTTPAIFTPSGSDPVYLAVRYAAAPAVTPSVMFELCELNYNSEYLKATFFIINNDTKTAVCNGTCDNLPNNIISRVSAGVGLTNEPFASAYSIITLGKYNTRTNSDVQIAFSNSSYSLKWRFYEGGWSNWKTGTENLEEIANLYNLHCDVTLANNRFPRIALNVTSGHTYVLRLRKVISDETIDTTILSQGETQFTTGLENGNPFTFTPSGDDPVYLTVRYAATPAITPSVLYELQEITAGHPSITASNLIVTNDNKTAFMNDDVDNAPLNTITGIGNSVTELEHNPFLSATSLLATIGKYFSRTTGDTQFAMKSADGTLATRSYLSGSFQPWQFHIPVSRFPGRRFAIIGDSIGTFNQVPYKIEGYNMAYPYLNVTSVDLTWWMKVISASGALLDINASSSGSRVTNTRNDRPDLYDRCNVLSTPDTIFIELGTNDSLNNVALGTYDYDTTYESLPENTFREAYIKGIKALKNNYSNAQIVCVILSMDDDYANSIKAIAEHLECDCVDCRGYTIGDNTVHPGIIGMRQIASKLLYPETAIF